MRIPGRRQATVYTVTDAARPHSEDIDERRKKYIFWMAVRTVCFILAIVLVIVLDGQARVIAFFAVALPAIVLPMFTVISANAGKEPTGPRFAPYEPPRQQIDPSRDGDHTLGSS